MNQYSRQFLRDRFLAEQQDQLAEDAKLDDPAVAYRSLVEERWSDAGADDLSPAADRAA